MIKKRPIKVKQFLQVIIYVMWRECKDAYSIPLPIILHTLKSTIY